MSRANLAVVGYGNMAKAIIKGALDFGTALEKITVFDINLAQYTSEISSDIIFFSETMEAAVSGADAVLLSVKPQNFPEILSALKEIDGYEDKLYISIAAGITVDNISKTLGTESVVRTLPNIPMTIGQGVSLVCKNESVSREDFSFVKALLSASGGVLEIEELEINRLISVTSSSPAYVFKFIDAICKGAVAQGFSYDRVLDTVCDVLIGSALMLKGSNISPEELISRVASKGGTTQRALDTLDEYNFSEGIIEAMKACTRRADELGSIK